MRCITVGFYGMTHLGLVSAVAAADKHHNVICFDSDEALVCKLKQKKYPIQEPGLLECVVNNEEYLTYTAQLDCLMKADLIYISIDVPTDINNQSDLRPIKKALDHLRTHLRQGQVIVVLSQVSPGFMRKFDFPPQQLFYQVETLVFGNAIARAINPERLIVGCSDVDQYVPSVFNDFLKSFHCPILVMCYESAELAKISINMYLVSSVMTSNMLAELAAAVGANWKEIVPALRLDKRIGPYAYLNPGLGISGGNLERDMMTVIDQANKHHVHSDLVNVWLADNRYYKTWVWRCLQRHVFIKFNSPTITILGLTYKVNTHSIKNSPAIDLIESLNSTKSCVRVHDPVLDNYEIEGVERCHSSLHALQASDVLVIMTPWPDYSKLSAKDLISQMRGKIVVDPFHVLNHEDLFKDAFHVFTLGNTMSCNHEKEVNYA